MNEPVFKGKTAIVTGSFSGIGGSSRFERRPQYHDDVAGTAWARRCPGFAASSRFARAFDRMAADRQKTAPLDRVAQPEDIAGVVAFIAGPASRNITGEAPPVDGGLYLTLGSADFR